MNEADAKKLITRAQKGDAILLGYSEVALVRNEYGETLLHMLANAGCKDVVKHPLAATVRDEAGETPLHFLARQGFTEVLAHPEVASATDKDGDTPLSALAKAGVQAAIERLQKWRIREVQVGGDDVHSSIASKLFNSKEEAFEAAKVALASDYEWDDSSADEDGYWLTAEARFSAVREDGGSEDEFDFTLERQLDDIAGVNSANHKHEWKFGRFLIPHGFDRIAKGTCACGATVKCVEYSEEHGEEAGVKAYLTIPSKIRVEDELSR